MDPSELGGINAHSSIPSVEKRVQKETLEFMLEEARKELFTGRKDDIEKPALFLNPPEIQYGMARAFMHGERKYGTYNWMGGIKVSRLWSACVRHLLAWFWEQTPDESGLDHLDHAAASLAMLMDTAKRFPNLDDRPKKEKVVKGTHGPLVFVKEESPDDILLSRDTQTP